MLTVAVTGRPQVLTEAVCCQLREGTITRHYLDIDRRQWFSEIVGPTADFKAIISHGGDCIDISLEPPGGAYVDTSLSQPLSPHIPQQLKDHSAPAHTGNQSRSWFLDAVLVSVAAVTRPLTNGAQRVKGAKTRGWRRPPDLQPRF